MSIAAGVQPCPTIRPSNLLLATKTLPNHFPLKTPNRSNPKLLKLTASSSAGTLEISASGEEDGPMKKRLVVAKPMERPRLVLKFVWMDKNVGIALDQVIPGGHGTIPVSPYYFWPRKDAWDELRVVLESKPWISRKQAVVLLNQATDIINLWQATAEI
ncbi:30S ribosomal protein 3-1- chloroplastic [Striga hermonthica]|uniref:30S ribosomal protein 3, chloroplastic n=1 Tax=Striga hermonthica TaxID=68872 RepID=A0A9N7RH41_STRHE|nr:30S ribosomal protein 3-1- chloroplastic [Striga hermonthica]